VVNLDYERRRKKELREIEGEMFALKYKDERDGGINTFYMKIKMALLRWG
jgi:hypothetical protein